jgi:DNA-binding NarL/FixJ family response regulator
MGDIAKTRILIVDDHELCRDGLKMLINREADMEVVGEAENGQRAITLADDLQPDVIIMDIKMPVMDGIEATRRIVAKRPGMKILALSVYSDTIFYAEMMRAGALGYIVKGDNFEEMSKTIHRVARSRKPLAEKR